MEWDDVWNQPVFENGSQSVPHEDEITNSESELSHLEGLRNGSDIFIIPL